MTFAYRPVGHDGLERARHRRQRAVPRLPRRQRRLAKGTLVEYRAVAEGHRGHFSAASTYGDRRRPGDAERRRERGVGPVTQPDTVSVPGRPQLRDGLRRRLAAGLRPGPADPRPQGPDLEGHLHAARPAPTPTRPRSTRRGTRTTAPAACQNGGEHHLHRARRQPVTFYYDHAHALGHLRRRRARSSPRPAPSSPSWAARPTGPGLPAVVAAGPRRRRHLHLAPPTRSRPATTRSRSPTACTWDENYGAGGAPGGANIAFTVPVRRQGGHDHLRPGHPRPDGQDRHGRRRPGPDQGQGAYWVGPDLVAWPATACRPAPTPALLHVAAALVGRRRPRPSTPRRSPAARPRP